MQSKAFPCKPILHRVKYIVSSVWLYKLIYHSCSQEFINSENIKRVLRLQTLQIMDLFRILIQTSQYIYLLPTRVWMTKFWCRLCAVLFEVSKQFLHCDLELWHDSLFNIMDISIRLKLHLLSINHAACKELLTGETNHQTSWLCT
jgi:hypothetical protein